MKNLEFLSNGKKLKGSIIFPQALNEKNPTILFVHGWTSAKERSYQYAKGLAELGYISFLFDMRGHGESEGDINTFTTKDFLDDIIIAYDYLVKVKGADKDNISAIGSSLGGYLVALLVAKRKVKNLVLRAPADYDNYQFEQLKHLYGGEIPEVMAWRKQPKQPNETYALQAVNNFSGNILIIESEKDDSIPPQTIENYINAVKDKNKLTHIIMKNVPHSIKEGKFRDEVERILVDWFKNKI